nr:hypothetical 9.2 kDa protein [Bradyrhizobium sp. DOA9]
MPLLPVLSPIFQPAGSPPRRRFAPVLQFTIQSVSRAREGGDNASPVTSRRKFPAIAAGVVVSRGSPGCERLSAGSLWSSREVVSPSDRQNVVSAAGPPIRASSRLAQVLSLSSTMALHISPTDILPAARFSFATGAYSSRSAWP